MAQGVAEQTNMAFSSMTAGRRLASDMDTESLVIPSRRRDSDSSWQDVVVTTSSVAVLLLAAIIAAWKLRHSATATCTQGKIL